MLHLMVLLKHSHCLFMFTNNIGIPIPCFQETGVPRKVSHAHHLLPEIYTRPEPMSGAKEHQSSVHCYVPSIVEWGPRNSLYTKHFYGMGGATHNATCRLTSVKDQHFYSLTDPYKEVFVDWKSTTVGCTSVTLLRTALRRSWAPVHVY